MYSSVWTDSSRTGTTDPDLPSRGAQPTNPAVRSAWVSIVNRSRGKMVRVPPDASGSHSLLRRSGAREYDCVARVRDLLHHPRRLTAGAADGTAGLVAGTGAVCPFAVVEASANAFDAARSRETMNGFVACAHSAAFHGLAAGGHRIVVALLDACDLWEGRNAVTGSCCRLPNG